MDDPDAVDEVYDKKILDACIKFAEEEKKMKKVYIVMCRFRHCQGHWVEVIVRAFTTEEKAIEFKKSEETKADYGEFFYIEPMKLEE